MVEIGPGLGALTEPLIERLATPESPLHAVELDRDLIARSKSNSATCSNCMRATRSPSTSARSRRARR